MNDNDLRIGKRGTPIHFKFDGEPVDAFDGETVATALWARGIRAWEGGRTYFCAMGVCQQCAVWIDGMRVEACRTIARAGLDVRSGA
jgi:aerobic-type carbon monoxide dehydrogenase small subunit (CoxS/CutS family)